MNKKLLAIAVGATLVAPMLAAQADVKVYGRIYGELASEKNGNPATFDGITQDDNQGESRVGVQVTEDLGNGLKAFGVVEWGFDVNDNCSTTTSGTSCALFQNRIGYAGISGGFGSVALGTFDGAYKTAGGVGYDPFVATGLQARGNAGMAASAFGQSSYVNPMVEYKSPNFGGFTGQVQYGVAEGTAADGDMLIALKYGAKDWEVVYGYAKDDGTNKKNQKIGGKAKFGNFTVTGQYEATDITASTFDGGPGKFLYASLTYQMGNWGLTGALGQYNADAASKDADYLALGARYSFSKNTSAIIGYRKTDSDVNSKDSKATVLGLDLRF